MESKELKNLQTKPAFILAGIAGLIAIPVSLLAISDNESETFWSNATLISTSAMSVGTGVLLLSKSKSAGLERRAHVLLVVSLSLWLAAEVTWMYYELGLGVETPFPSAADGLWLAGYGPFIYFVVQAYRLIGAGIPERRLISMFLSAIITSAIVAVFLFPIIDSAFSAGGHWVELLIGISYPILDGVLIAISILTIASLRPGQARYHFAPYVLIMATMITFVIADTGFGYEAASDMQLLEEHDRIWDSLYGAGYVCMAGALYWYYRLYRLQQKQ